MDNNLAATISVADSKAEYDENIKNILSEKEILAWILQSTTIEFSKLSIEEIIKCMKENQKFQQ